VERPITVEAAGARTAPASVETPWRSEMDNVPKVGDLYDIEMMSSDTANRVEGKLLIVSADEVEVRIVAPTGLAPGEDIKFHIDGLSNLRFVRPAFDGL
jgi:hypothetical protein